MSDERTPVDRVKAFLIESDYFHTVGMIAVATGLSIGQVNQIIYDLKGMGLVVMKHTKRGQPSFAWHSM